MSQLFNEVMAMSAAMEKRTVVSEDGNRSSDNFTDLYIQMLPKSITVSDVTVFQVFMVSDVINTLPEEHHEIAVVHLLTDQ